MKAPLSQEKVASDCSGRLLRVLGHQRSKTLQRGFYYAGGPRKAVELVLARLPESLHLEMKHLVLTSILSLCALSPALARTPAEAEAILLQSMQSMGKFIQYARHCKLPATRTEGFAASYAATYKLAAVTGLTTKEQLDDAYQKGARLAVQAPPSPFKCELFSKDIKEMDDRKKKIAAEVEASIEERQRK